MRMEKGLKENLLIDGVDLAQVEWHRFKKSEWLLSYKGE